MMSDIAIKVENLGKRYQVGHNTEHKDETFREAVNRSTRDLIRKSKDMLSGRPIIQGDEVEDFWALNDVSFEIKQGDRVGIIGRNGAGKSTLLKILSRITEPTTGRIQINGRVASLLEVGTGFHPELTGRENIYLNGAILGMSRREIRRKFDEIVTFAEVEKFLDTPVKRYSSGMYVRLAFAVAAHLEPEILIVDEVLAVGDAQFQKKCLGKMEEVGKEGRTILFVSHNMAAIRNLCPRTIMLEGGEIVADDNVSSAIDQYLSFGEGHNLSEIIWSNSAAPACPEMTFKSIRILGPDEKPLTFYDVTKPINIEIQYEIKKPLKGMRIVLSLLTLHGEVAFSSTNHALIAGDELVPGMYKANCIIPPNLLNSTSYTLRVHVGQPGVRILIPSNEYLCFVTEGAGGHGSSYSERWPGVVAPELKWKQVML